jgi:xanthine dehydrogenase accessory factor
MDEKDIFRALVEAQDKGFSVALCTVIRTQGSLPRHAGSKMLVYPDGHIIGTVGGGGMEARVIADAQTALREGTPRTVSYTLTDLKNGDPGVCGGTLDIFVEPIGTLPTLVVIGCGHVGKALAELGKWTGFRVVVVDDRPDFCNPTYIPGMDGYLVTPSGSTAEQIPTGPNVYVATVTRGVPIDTNLLPPLLRANLGYLGVIGSRRRWALTIKALEDQGITRDLIARIHAPIGLELNAETPQEIALSILAEIVMIRRGGTGAPMRWMGTLDSSLAGRNDGKVDMPPILDLSEPSATSV